MSPERSTGAVELLRRFAAYCDELREPAKAQRFRELADGLGAGPDKEQAREIWANVVRQLRGGHGTITDRYLTTPSGAPDVERSREFLAVIDQLKTAARKSLPWLTYRRLWKNGT